MEQANQDMYVILGKTKHLRLLRIVACAWYMDSAEAAYKKAQAEHPKGIEVTVVKPYKELPIPIRFLVRLGLSWEGISVSLTRIPKLRSIWATLPTRSWKLTIAVWTVAVLAFLGFIASGIYYGIYGYLHEGDGFQYRLLVLGAVLIWVVMGYTIPVTSKAQKPNTVGK